MKYAIRYKPTSDLGRRFTAHGGTYTTRHEAEALLRMCANASVMEIVEVNE